MTIGSWLSFGNTSTCEMMAKAGFDWLVIDMEHTAIGIGDAQQMIQIIDLAGCAPLVRVGGNEEGLIKRVMDAGAFGVIVPMVNSKEDAQKAVNSVRYPPAGTRGAGLGRAQSFGMDFEKYREWVEQESVLIVQIEHIQAVKNIDEILAVDGVDGFIVGPYDLSASLGVPGQLEHRSVAAALEEVKRAVRKGGKAGGFHVVHSDHDLMLKIIKDGYRFIAYGDDMVFLGEKIKQETQFLKRISGAGEG